MENSAHTTSGTTPHTASGTRPHTASGATGSARPPAARTGAEWLGLVALALFVLLVGAVVRVVGPLLSFACAACQEGVRGPLPFDAALIALAQVGVPLITLGTVAGVFHPRGGARAGAIGLGLLGVLLCAMPVLGRIAA